MAWIVQQVFVEEGNDTPRSLRLGHAGNQQWTLASEKATGFASQPDAEAAMDFFSLQKCRAVERADIDEKPEPPPPDPLATFLTEYLPASAQIDVSELTRLIREIDAPAEAIADPAKP